MKESAGLKSAATTATVAAFLMIANQVAGKATRDAVFLAQFDVTLLPTLLILGAAVSLGAVVGVARLMSRWGPDQLTPRIFAISGLLLLAQWGIAARFPGTSAILLYFHIAVFGSILISGFWSLINELFDPRSGKRLISRIATGGTLGGLAGGIAAERVAAGLEVSLMLPLLGAMHLASGLLLARIGGTEEAAAIRSAPKSGSLSSTVDLLKGQPYLRTLARLVLIGTACAAIIDYSFKEQAARTLTEEGQLLRFFAVYYTGISLLTVILQGSLSRFALQRLGVVRTAGFLPFTLLLGGLANLLVPSLVAATAARAGEAVLRNSLYRSAYELLYTPVPPTEKRAVKTIIDVGFERLGDAVGGGLVRLILALSPFVAAPLLPLAATFLGVFGLITAARLHRGYVETLERSLRTKAVDLDLDQVEDRTTRQTLVQTYADLEIPAFQAGVTRTSPAPIPRRDRTPGQRLDVLCSGDRDRVRNLLRQDHLDRLLVPQVIRLLAWDEVVLDVIQALRRAAPRITGQLIDALLDPDQDFPVRRRLPRILSAAEPRRAADGLLAGLGDPRFEVRYQCGRALLSILSRNPGIQVPADEVLAAIEREMKVERPVWDSHRLLDQFHGADEDPAYLDELVRNRSNRSLEHVFTLLALMLPRAPLMIAYRALHTNDPGLRGTALEYLDSVLPEGVRKSLWPYLEAPTERPRGQRTREEILSDLLRSHHSIQLSLKRPDPRS